MIFWMIVCFCVGLISGILLRKHFKRTDGYFVVDHTLENSVEWFIDVKPRLPEIEKKKDLTFQVIIQK